MTIILPYITGRKEGQIASREASLKAGHVVAFQGGAVLPNCLWDDPEWLQAFRQPGGRALRVSGIDILLPPYRPRLTLPVYELIDEIFRGDVIALPCLGDFAAGGEELDFGFLLVGVPLVS